MILVQMYNILDYRGKKCQMILVQMYNIFGLLIGVPDYSIRSESYGRKQKNVEKDWHLNKQL